MSKGPKLTKAEKKQLKIDHKAAKKQAKIDKKALKKEQRIEHDRKKFMKTYFSKRIEGADKFDHLILKDYETAFTRAKTVLGLTEKEANCYSPLIVSLPEVFHPKSKLQIKLGKKNDHLRYNQSRVTMLLFDEKQLYYYTVLIDHENSEFSDDYSVEVPYEGIVSQEIKSFRLFENKKYHHFVDYQLFLVNDHSITIRVKDIVKLEKDLQKGVSIPEDSLKVLSGVNRFLREKRGL